MTSGTKGVSFSPYSKGGHVTTWLGADGKYETVSGKKRVKWNQYTRTTRWQTQTPKANGSWLYDISASPPSMWSGNDQNALLAKLASKAKEHDFQMGVAVAEGSRTVQMVAKSLGDIGSALRFLKRGDFASAARCLGTSPRRGSRLVPKDISGRWLELQYGWLPMLNDVFESAKAFENLSSGPRKQTIVAKRGLRTIYSASASPSLYTGTGPLFERRQIRYERSEELTALRSLGLADPLSVAWELVPYSFVIDWFVPIGTYLSNLSVIPNLKGRFLSSSRRSWDSQAYPIGAAYVAAKEATCKYKYEQLTRSVSTSLSVPRPGFVKVPDAMSPKRIWNAIALAHQKIR
jgi:hypothetical protein